MPKKILETEARRKITEARDKATKRLVVRGWRHDGLWWYSPYTACRYLKREALYVEELREWAEGDSAFLGDKNHSMWVKAEEDDNAILSVEEASRKCQIDIEVRKLGRSSCYNK
jgi:hypothetical protein